MSDQELTIALAERVMGIGITTAKSGDCFIQSDDIRDGEPWSPLTDWNDAMELAEKWACAHTHRRVRIYSQGDQWVAEPEDWSGVYNGWLAIAKPGPRAVTLAIARAVGIEL